MRIPVAEVPLEVRRVAAQHLESLRGSELMEGAEDAHVGSSAVPIYRPDLDEIAYYELSVVGHGPGESRVIRTNRYPCPPEGDAVNEADSLADAAEQRPIGFIVASSGRHDFPIAHWSLDRLPPSHQAATGHDTECEEPELREGEPARLYKLDALAYAAENEAGELVGRSGQLPAPLAGLPHSLDRYAGQVASAISGLRVRADDDHDAEGAKHRMERSKSEPPSLRREEEGDWPALKERYAEAFGPLLDHLRGRAAAAWEVEDAIREFGEGILAGTTHRVALLDEASIELDGEGAKYVNASVEENPAGPPSLLLHAVPGSVAQELGFEVRLEYRSGEEERLSFFVVSRDVPSNTKAERSAERDSDCEE